MRQTVAPTERVLHERHNAEKSRWGVLCALFTFLERESIPYVVLGDYTKTREDRDGDVDIAVAADVIDVLPKLLVRFAFLVEARVVQSIRHEATAYFYVLAWQGRDGTTHLLQLDICSDYRRGGRTLIPADVLLENRSSTETDGIWIFQPSPEIGLAYYLVKKVEKNELRAGHGRLLSQMIARTTRSNVASVLEDLFGPQGMEILNAGISRGDWEEVAERLEDLKAMLRRRRRRSIDSVSFEMKRILHRILVPTGFNVVVLGPDGAGKSTVIAALRRELKLAFWGTEYFHLRPHLGRHVSADSAVPVEDPHGARPRSMPASFLKLFYYAVDYILGHFALVKPLLVRSRLVVFDRYYHDLLVDPYRYRLAGPMWFARALRHLIPTPDLFIFLEAPADVIRERKTEVSTEETQRQLVAYRDLAMSLRSSVIIDASGSAEHVSSIAVDSLLDKLAERLERRFWLR